MPKQYSKDKTSRLSFRVNDALYNWVEARAHALGVSPCDYARSLLFQQMSVEEALRSVETPKTPIAEIARARNAHGKEHK